MDISKYKVKEIIYDEDCRFDEFIQYLSGILNDSSVPENNKQDIRKQFDEIIKLKNITMQPPKVVLELIK